MERNFVFGVVLVFFSASLHPKSGNTDTHQNESIDVSFYSPFSPDLSDYKKFQKDFSVSLKTGLNIVKSNFASSNVCYLNIDYLRKSSFTKRCN